MRIVSYVMISLLLISCYSDNNYVVKNYEIIFSEFDSIPVNKQGINISAFKYHTSNGNLIIHPQGFVTVNNWNPSFHIIDIEGYKFSKSTSGIHYHLITQDSLVIKKLKIKVSYDKDY